MPSTQPSNSSGQAQSQSANGPIVQINGHPWTVATGQQVTSGFFTNPVPPGSNINVHNAIQQILSNAYDEMVETFKKMISAALKSEQHEINDSNIARVALTLKDRGIKDQELLKWTPEQMAYWVRTYFPNHHANYDRAMSIVGG